MIKTDMDALCQAYRKQMLRVAGRVLHNPADAEDAVQNALLRISQVGSLPQEHKALRAYVLAAARNAALDLLPMQSRDMELDEAILPDREDVFNRIAEQENYDRLLETIRGLPLKYREVLMLRYVQELDTEQMAVLLGRSRGTVQKQLFRAKELLIQKYYRE